MWFDWLFEEIAVAAASRVKEEAARPDGSWEALWRLLYGLTSIGSPPLRSVAHKALAQERKALTGSMRARQPEWLRLLPKLAATGEVWEMHDVYRTRFAVIAGFRYPGGTDPAAFLFDVNTCDIVRLASAGVFDDVQHAARTWRELVGDGAHGAEPTVVDTPERLYSLAYLDAGERHVEGDEPRVVLDNWFRVERRLLDVADALRRRRMAWPVTRSLYRDLDTASMEKTFQPLVSASPWHHARCRGGRGAGRGMAGGRDTRHHALGIAAPGAIPGEPDQRLVSRRPGDCGREDAAARMGPVELRGVRPTRAARRSVSSCRRHGASSSSPCSRSGRGCD